MFDLTLKCKKLHPDAILPTRATEYDAGYDLYALEKYIIEPSKHKIIRTGISVRMPELPHPFKVYGSIRSRSGLSAKHNVEVGAGVVDFGYDKEICVILHNFNKSFLYKKYDPFGNYSKDEGGDYFVCGKGDRIAQLVLEVHVTPNVEEVDNFDDLQNNSRDGGFGSSGNQ